jgi:alpha-L-rhamnosidase
VRNPTDTTLSARFISPADDWNGAPLLRRSFTLDHESTEIAEATLFLSAHGVVEAFLGGEKISPDLLTPGWSSYEWRMRYAEYDVREFLNERENVLGLSLGNGWWRGRLGWTGERALYGGEIAGLAELRIVFSDGSSQTITTSANSGWLAAGSGTTANDLYDGQAIDARLRPQRWLSPDFDASDWSAEFREVQISDSTLEPYVGPPVRAQEARAPQGVWRSPQGRLLVDFGQNLVGWVRLRVRGPEGHTITLRHAEVLEFGELGVRPLRSARATDTYILSGDADTFEPTFTFHGFRYVEVDGWFGADQDVLGALEAVVIHSDLRRIGHFSCSDPLLTRLHANVVWSMRGNIVDVPTDCPQRDERLGWTGDLSAFVATGAFLYDVEDFLRDWLRDLALEQEHGNVGVPAVVPDALK